MTKTSKTIVFFGTEEFSAIALKRLLEHHKVELVVTKPDSVRGRGRKIQSPTVKKIALEHDIEVLQPDRMTDLIDRLSELDNPLGVLVSYGKIIPQVVLDLFPDGIINIHPSLLPKYRGPSPIESTISNGDKYAGVSLMKLIDRMDAGPIISQASMETNDSETQISLYDTLADMGSELMLSFLSDYKAGMEATLQEQDESLATYTNLLSKDMTSVDPLSLTAPEIERRIRAHLRYPKTSLPLLGEKRIIMQAHATTLPTDLSIECAGDSWLEVDKLISPSGKTITLKDLTNSLNNK